jgi:ABC-type glycerol-3-phosphate transport system substrate-binding protein
MNAKLVSARLFAIASALALTACGGGDTTPISGTTQSEADALNSAAEMLEQSDDSVTRARATPQ